MKVGEMLVLDEIPDEFAERYGASAIPKHMYIRKCYVELYDLVTAEMIKQQTTKPAMLFTGVPGIGKSMFMIYFLYRYQTDSRFTDKRFALEFGHGRYHYFEATATSTSKDGVATSSFMCSISVTRKEFPLNEVLVFADIGERRQPETRAKWTLIFSSPDPERFKDFMKGKPGYMFLLPTWSEDELLYANEHRNEWYGRFVVCGGVPRVVLWDGIGYDPMNTLNQTLLDKGPRVADYFYKHGFGDIDAYKSYSMIHINPPFSPEKGRLLYECDTGLIVRTFASNYVCQELTRMHSKGIITSLVELFNAGGGLASERLGGVSAGHLFEKICSWIVPLANQNITIDRFPPLSSLAMNISVPPWEILDSNWKDLKNHRIGVLYQPQISNLESGDAFGVIQNGTELILIVLQYTIDDNHPVKVNGLKNIVESYPQEIKDHMNRKLLIFVTPVDGKLQKVQPLHSQGGRVMTKLPSEVKDFEQWVCRYFIEMT